MQLRMPHRNNLLGPGLLFSILCMFMVFVPQVEAGVVVENRSNYGVIKGFIRDQQGNPISDAVVAVFKTGTAKLLKQVRTSVDGSFIARIVPGKYTVLAVAQGFNPITLPEVQVNRATETSYGFKLERSGSGNTLPEKRADRNSSKWRLRAAQNRRSIYQAKEGAQPVDENAATGGESVASADSEVTFDPDEETPSARKSRSVVETYFGATDQARFAGLNFATLQPIGDDVEIVFAGQTGSSSFAPQRFETKLQFRPNEEHQISVSGAVTKPGKLNFGPEQKDIGQISVQALDEWKIKDGVILVVGFDFSRFVGAANDQSFSPRIGLQYDLNSKTRLKGSYTPQSEERTWGEAVDLEGAQVLFRQNFSEQVVAVDDDKPVLNRSRRLEFGIERILDNNSSIEATAFFDTINGRGVGLVNMPLGFLNSGEGSVFAANQQGKAQGVRVVYSRRFGQIFSASAAYSFGNGQKLSADGITNPANLFENAVFQSFAGQVNADLNTGTRIKTIFRLSPQATIFAIDPFAGRLAIYDPSLSVLVTQPLPNLGLPIRAEAVIDARNIFDFQTSVFGEEGGIKLNSHRRIFRGGIQVRF